MPEFFIEAVKPRDFADVRVYKISRGKVYWRYRNRLWSTWNLVREVPMTPDLLRAFAGVIECTEREAGMTQKAKRKYHGKFAKLNFP